MKRPFAGSSRARLALVLVLAVIPSLGLIYYNAREQRRAAVDRAQQDVERIARLTAAQNTRVIEGTRQILVTLTQFPEIQGNDSTRCSTALQKLLGEYSLFSNLGVAAPDGTVVCSAMQLKNPLSVADTSWFQQVMKTKDFAVGEYQKSRSSGRPSLSLACPIMGPDDRVQRIVFASLELDYLGRQMGSVAPPEGTILAVVDRNGVILGQTGGNGELIGRPAPEAGLIKDVSLQRARGADQWFDPSGVERIYAFYPIGGKRAGVNLYVTASIPTSVAFADANRQLKKNLLGLAVVALLALAAAWYGGESIVLRQTNNELEHRVQDRTKELAHEQFLLRTLLDNVPDSIYFKDEKGRFLRSSRAQAKRFGLSDPAQAIGKTDFDFFTKDHAQEAFVDEQQIIQTGQPLIGMEENSPLADGTDRWVSTSKLPLRDKEGNIVGTFGISREFTERKRVEQTLAKERNLLHTLIDNLPDLVFIKDMKGRYVFDNAAHRAFMGVATLDDVVGKTVFDFYPKEFATKLHTDDEAVQAAGLPVLNREEELVDRKGRKVPAVISKIPYRDEQRKVVGLVCICHRRADA